VLARIGGARIERIATPSTATPGPWYDQDGDEWVAVLQGEAVLRLEDPEQLLTLRAGEGGLIARHRRHRVERVARPTLWLAVHLPPSGVPSAVVVIDPDPAWPDRFRELRDGLAPALAGLPIRIEHVGSTSVPGLAAKPRLDIDIILPTRDVAVLFDRVKTALEGLGYRHQGDLGIPGRAAFRQPEGAFPHNLYVCPDDLLALKNHLHFRDHLRARPDVRDRYAELKRDLAARFPDDVDAYCRGKTDFIIDCLRAAGMDAATVEAIRRVNLP
jgi:GrpB-like predicted nucleotidyltransferase (UPF0157 family)